MASEIAPVLEVWLLGERAGTLWLKEGELQFQYNPRWLEQPGAIPLSQSLPLQAEPFADQICRPFFSGLLPEGQLRQRITQQCQISQSNDFGLLAAIGGDCAGAVSLTAGNQATVPAAVEWLDQDQLIALLDELPQRPMLAQRDGLRLSLAGAQGRRRQHPHPQTSDRGGGGERDQRGVLHGLGPSHGAEGCRRRENGRCCLCVATTAASETVSRG